MKKLSESLEKSVVTKKDWKVTPWASEEAMAGAERIDMSYCHEAQSRTPTIYRTEHQRRKC